MKGSHIDVKEYLGEYEPFSAIHRWRCTDPPYMRHRGPDAGSMHMTSMSSLAPKLSSWSCINNEPFWVKPSIHSGVSVPTDHVSQGILNWSYLGLHCSSQHSCRSCQKCRNLYSSEVNMSTWPFGSIVSEKQRIFLTMVSGTSGIPLGYDWNYGHV